MRSIFKTAALSALTYSSLCAADIQQACPSGANGVCYSVAVPEASASSGSGDIYFQITGPTSFTWIALGTGTMMADSNIFLMYADGAGNVTVSPRQGTYHQEPKEDTSSTAAKLTLLAGSGVNGTTMTANVMCSNCQTWANGGSMSLTSSSSSWVAAWKSGSALDSTDKNAEISQHDDTSIFQFDLTKATVAADSNPFVAASSSSGSSSGGGTTSGSNPTTSTTDVGADTSKQETSRMIKAHGIIMAVVFVILYPVGSILMPLLGKWVLHAVWQSVAFVLMWVGFALGIVVSRRTFINFGATHTLFGTVVVCLMLLQPVLGWLHHAHYVKNQRRGPVSYAHIAYGRILMILGVVNGGLGLKLAGSTMVYTAYAVVAAVVGIAYIAIKIFTSWKKRKNGGAGGKNAMHPVTSGEAEMERSGR